MRTLLLTCLCLAACHLAPAAMAAEEAATATETESGTDAPSRVARLAFKEGEVEMAPAGTEEWTEALLNRPLTTDDRLWVGNGAKAELQVGSAAIYLDADSGFTFLDLDDDLLHMSLTGGAATIRVRRKSESESIEIETPNATVTLLHPGEYHIEVTEDGAATVVNTRSGESEVSGEKDTYKVRANEKGIFRGTDELQADIGPLGPRTSFEDWANEREGRDESARSAQYVSRDVIGYEDLDDDGEWVHEPEYGYVWTPTFVAAGWAPYRFGRWVWVSPWGWTWVDNYRWGFAPFHYGRWAHVRNRWCWVPGPRHIRPVYAPALVGWVGGSGISVSIGTGIGWFPLGPREVYMPGYWHSRRYIRSVNVSNTLIINNTYIDNYYHGRGRYDYRYGRHANAVTVVSRDRFVGGRPLEGYVRVADRDLRRWHHDGRPPAIAPNRQSVLASRVVTNRPQFRPLIRANQLDADRGNSAFLARRTGPTRVPFEVERRAIEANRGRPVDRTQIISNNPRAIARGREDFRNEWARRAERTPNRDADRNARAQPAPNPPALQPSKDLPRGRGPDKSFGRERTLSDRPEWARREGDALRSHVVPRAERSERPDRPQRTDRSETRTVRIPVRERDRERSDSRPGTGGSAAPRVEPPNATTGFSELRREPRSRIQGGDSTRERVREQAQARESGRPSFGGTNRSSSENRERRFERAPTPPPQQYSPPARQQPRETPPPRVREQPTFREQSRQERSSQQEPPRREPSFRSEPSFQRAAPQRSEAPSRSQGASQGSSRSSSHEGRSNRSFQNGR